MNLPDVVAPVRHVGHWLGDARGRRSRRVNVVGDRAHVELRAGSDPRAGRLHRSVVTALERLDAVDWAEVDAVLGRVVIAFDPSEVELDDLLSVVEDVEDAHEVADERFPHDRPDHPGDIEPVQRQIVALATDVAGLGLVAAGQLLRLDRIPSEIPGLVALADSRPRVRQVLEDRLGPPTTDLVVAGTAAFAQALSQGPVGLIADIATRGSLVAEQLARREAWRRREPDLVAGAHSVRYRPVEVPRRESPLPRGPVERYAQGAAIASLGAVGATLALSRNPRRAADQVLLSVPKAANAGRESFAAWLGVALAQRGVLVMDPAALRRLDRATTLVVDARLLSLGRWVVERVEPVGDDDHRADVAARARALLDATDPTGTTRRGSWILRPWAPDDRAPRGTDAEARRLRRGGRKVLGLWRGDRLRALVVLAEDPEPQAVLLVAAARRAGLEVVLAGGTDGLAARLGDVVRWPATSVVDEIRAHQAAGNVVLYASGRAHRGLRAADVGIGVPSDGRRAPLGAHLVIDAAMGQGFLVVEAVSRARSASRRSALLAAAGTSVGSGWALVGSPWTAASRTMLAINTSALAAVATGAATGLGLVAVSVPRPASTERWHELDAGAALGALGSSRDGLDPDVRASRLRLAPPRLDGDPVGWVRATADELANPLTPLLAFGSVLSVAVGSVTDAGLVLGVVGMNALVGAAQRVQTERALQALAAEGTSFVEVLVAGEPTIVPADEVVVGDVVRLGAGERVPADCRVLEARALEVDEATLTGESVPVAKAVRPTPGAAVPDRTSMLYEGTVVAAGEVTAVVVATGVDTETGRSLAAAGEPPVAGVERRLRRLTDLTVPATVGAGALATGIGFAWRRPTREAVGAGVSLMVAAVPEGLPALATLAQVAAARRLAGRNALVRNARAIEALGRVQQVCFDKTGTLTEGHLSLVAVSDGAADEPVAELGRSTRRVLALALAATPPANGNGVHAHSTDRAVAEAAEQVGARRPSGWQVAGELPFESRRGLHAVVGHRAGAWWVVVKGAPEAVLARCTSWANGQGVELGPEQVRRLEDHVHAMARRGLRVLAVADAEVPAGTTLRGADDLPPLRLHGFVALADPVRPSAAEAVATLRGAGVHLAMITGDHPSTAEAVAAELGMLDGGRVLTGIEIEQLDDDELDGVIGEVAVFARVTPRQKVRIVAAYQRIGRPVAMTGDGANDAAAIRLADAGIALGGRGTDAARAAADVIVVDDRIETIVDAVVEGRAMWESVRGAVSILVGGNLGEMGFTLAGTALGGTAPLNPRQLLLVNLLTDMAPALAIALREPSDRSPEALLHAGPDASLGLALTRDIVVRAGATAAGATGAWAVARVTGTPTRARTVGLVALVGTQLGQTLVAGGRSPIVWAASAASAGLLVVVVQTPGVSQFFGCRPLGPVGWATAAASAATATGASVVVPWAAERVGSAVVAAARRAATAAPSVPFRSNPDPAPPTDPDPHPLRSTTMNPVPVVVAAAVVAVVPPLRRRVVPVAAAVGSAGKDVAVAALGGVVGVAGAAVGGVVDVAGAAVRGPAPDATPAD